MTTSFKIYKDNIYLETIEFDLSKTFFDLKKHISNDILKLEDNYIDIEILIEKTIRDFGKYNLDPGIFSRILDNRKLSDFNIKNLLLKINVIDTSLKFIEKPKSSININLKHSRQERIKNSRKKEIQENKKEFTYNINEFPEL